jgi:hypothetical protein
MRDPRGSPTGSASSVAHDHVERALWRMLSFVGVPLADLEAASAADPTWPLPWVMKADYLLSLTEPSLVGDARVALEQAAALMTPFAPERERAHMAAAQLALAGRWLEACVVWDRLLLADPCDGLALIEAHLFDFYRGDAPQLRQRIARVLPNWPADDPLLPYVLGMHAFGLEECHLYAQAEEVGRRAVASGGPVSWAVHAVAHVMEMQGRHHEGTEWLRQQKPAWAGKSAAPHLPQGPAEGNGLAGHLWWHMALFRLEGLDVPGALRLHDEHLGAERLEINLQRLDAAALLWRLQLLGADTGARFAALADGWSGRDVGAGHYAFNDLHALLALLGCGQIEPAQGFVATVAERTLRSEGSNRPMAQEVGLPLMRGLLAYSRGAMAEAVDLLYPVRAIAQRFGGSHAQRDLIDQTLLAACAQGGGAAVGRALLNERRLAKPATPLTEHWMAALG